MENLDKVFNNLATQLGNLRLNKQDHIFIDTVLGLAKKELTPKNPLTKDKTQTKINT